MLLKITHDMPEAERRQWVVVRLDDFTALPGVPVHADVGTGNAMMQVRPKADGDLGLEEFACGPYGLRIIPR